MSVINKMLQDLDKRHAAQNPAAPAGPDSGNLGQQVRPVKSPAIGSNLFWRIMGGVMVVVVAWVIWVMWQIMPRPVVTDLAYQWLAKGRTSPQPAAVSVALPAPASVPAAAPLVPTPAAPQPVIVGAAPAATTIAKAALPESAKIDMLRLATELLTPISSRSARSVPPAKSTGKPAAVKPEARAEKITGRLAEPAPRNVAPAPRARTAGAALDPGSIDKRVDITPRERAESEFRRAMSQVNQGRMAEGMEGLRATLAADSTYELARQTLVALLLEAKRTDEAAGLLQEGLAINPANIGYAMLLARIHVERRDPSSALALLQKFETVANSNAANAEYHGFVAALYQRLGRHMEAVEQYQGALRLTPGMGAWWVGLGISQDALSRTKDATESFHRAKDTGNLNAELLAYVERRLQQLQ